MGRPTTFNQDIADKICEIISTSHKGLVTICKQEGMPARTTVRQWIDANEKFAAQYARAKEDQADFLAEEIIDIADDTKDDTLADGKTNHENINRSRLRVDARKWVASKLKPKSWGDKLDVTTGGVPIRQSFVIGGKEIEF